MNKGRFTPRDLLDMRYAEGKDFVGFEVTSRLKLPEFSSTAVLVRIFNEENIRLTAMSRHTWEDEIVDFVIVDLAGTGKTPEYFVQKIRERFGGHLIDVRWAEAPAEGFIYDMFAFPLIARLGVDNVPVVIFPVTSLRSLIEGMIKEYGDQSFFILWELGFNIGSSYAEHWISAMKGKSMRNKLEAAVRTVQALGWCVVDSYDADFENDIYIFRVTHCLECEAAKHTTEQGCSLLSGIFTGIVSKLRNQAYKATEICCTRKGDEFCIFKVERSP